MDAKTRLIERNGPAAEKFCHFVRLQNNKAAEEVLGSLLPGEHIEIPLEFTVTHEVNISFAGLPGYLEYEGNSFEDLAAAIEKADLPFGNLNQNYSYWCVTFESPSPFKTYHSVDISLKLLNELKENSCHESIKKLATFFIARREQEEKDKIKKEEQRQKQIAANQRGLARRDLENRCYSLFVVDVASHYQNAWAAYNEAIKCSSRKDFAAAIHNNPFRSSLFEAHDNCVRNEPEFLRTLQRISDKELRRIAVEIYAKNFH